MKIKVNNKKLKNISGQLNAILPNVEILPVYSNVKLKTENNKLSIFAGNGEVFLKKEIEVEEIKGGTVIVNGKKFIDIIKNLPDENIDMYIEEENLNKLKILSKNVIYELIYSSDEDYVSEIEIPDKDFIKIDVKKLKNVFYPVIFAVAKNTSSVSTALRGTLFEIKNKNLSGVATDGHKLALCRTDIDVDGDYIGIIPPLFFKILELTNDDIIEILVDETKIYCKDNTTFITTRLMEGNYPEYRKVIPNNYPFKVFFNKEELIAGIKKVGIFSDRNTNGITMNLSSNKMQLYAVSPEMGDAQIDFEVDYTGNDFSISFNKNYLFDILRNVYDDKVKLEFVDNESALILSPAKEGDFKQLFLLMPIVF